jgi:hypothetical protein
VEKCYPTVDEARFGVYWVRDHTINLAPGKVGPPTRLTALGRVNGAWIVRQLLGWLRRAEARRKGSTQKPLAPLSESANERDSVLDPCCGTIIHAAGKLAREWRGIE